MEVLAQSYPPKREDECHRQKSVLEKLAKIVKDWVKELATERAEEVNAELFTFGSYCLQVDEPGDVIDTLCVGPNFVDHERDFLNILPVKLEKMSEVAGMKCVPEALIPFMSFKLDGVPIKLFYASIACFAIPEALDITHDSVLENINDVSFHSLSACREATYILELVPNLENFQTTLRCVKHWAKARGIWSNVSGFLGESAWSILVARVCQAHPEAVPSTLVINFFDIFANWYWPNPVMLCFEDKQLGKLKMWDPRKYEADRAHRMPIIAPAYPCRNLTSDATESTLRFMKEHFKFGDEKCKEIKNNLNWQDLFVPFQFFENYVRYLHIDIISATEEDLRTFKRWIEPGLRLSISQIEKSKLICHPCSIEFARSDSCAFFIGLSSEKLLGGIQIGKIVDPVIDVLKSWFNGWESKKPGMELRVDLVGNIMIKSRKWGKLGLPIVEVSDVP